MGRDLQKRKRRSSKPAVRQPSSRAKKITNPLGNDIIARNWDKKETMAQNYRRLGLVGRLKAAKGGAEPDVAAAAARVAADHGDGSVDASVAAAGGATDPFAVRAMGTAGVVGEVRVERDENGKIVRILRRENPLNDPLNELDTDSEADSEMADDGETWGGIDDDNNSSSNKKKSKKGKKSSNKVEAATDVVRQLEAEANRPLEKKIRGQSKGEQEWLEALVARHGDDTRAMARDRKLNPMQQTAADIARRLRKLQGL
ncbi:ribosome biogenesis protein Nop16 [Xylariales sp. PMI_506]|nr:ribosome biogenesis protein Nop16 [Xylariales sp. PMI_506]